MFLWQLFPDSLLGGFLLISRRRLRLEFMALFPAWRPRRDSQWFQLWRFSMNLGQFACSRFCTMLNLLGFLGNCSVCHFTRISLYFLLNDHSKKSIGLRCYSVIGHTSASPVRHRPRAVFVLGLTANSISYNKLICNVHIWTKHS